MKNSQQPKDITRYNERSLSTLARAITLARGRFSLIVVRCNYRRLREELLQRLREKCLEMYGEMYGNTPLQFREFVLPKSAKTLYTAIQSELKGEQPPALMVLGLEIITHVDDLLIATNQVRDEFRKNFQFPLVLWVTDKVHHKLMRLAPDFNSWAAIPILFERESEELIQNLRQEANGMFAEILETGSNESLENLAVDLASLSLQRDELESALNDFQRNGWVLEPDLTASLQFVLGRDDYAKGRLDEALEQYEQSLTFWKNTNDLERQGVLLFYIGQCYVRQANRRLGEERDNWELAKKAFQECIEAFEQAQRLDLVAKFINNLGESLQNLEAWDELESLAQRALTLHDTYGSKLQLAQDYGFLAAVALAHSKWIEAQGKALKALQILELATECQRQYRGLYFQLLARSQYQLGQLSESINSLETARQESEPQDNPQLYIEILLELRSHYFEQGDYLAAFDIKQEQRRIEKQYNFRAFIGAGRLQPQREVTQKDANVALEIAASGRQHDIERLIARLRRNDYKLIVIQGPSGVGKSSILRAGLVPALQQSAIAERDALPVVISAYTDWIVGLGRELAASLEKIGGAKTPNLTTTSDSSVILEQLRRNGDRNFLTVLIFDQFEEFFFACSDLDKRNRYFEFLRDCLNLPFVKVILSLREDYRHYLYYLLEWNELTPKEGSKNEILNSILQENIRYYLGNFSIQEAESVIKELTERAHFPLEPVLISQLVQDLADEKGEVRPIELQLVGAQLQEDGITTLRQYQQLGDNPKAKLVVRSLEAVVRDCGPENKDAAWKVLVSLTDEKGTRPLKTKDELAAALREHADKLDLILDIFLGANLVFRFPEESEERYQLVHDYLVEPIRQTYDFDRDERLRKAEEDKQLAQKKLNEVLKQQLREARLRVRILGIAVVSVVGLLLYAAYEVNQRSIAQVKALNSVSQARLASHDQLGALVEGVKAGKQLKHTLVNAELKRETEQTLRNVIVSNVQERNRLEGHNDRVFSISFSPDGKTIASASADRRVRLWGSDGKLLQTLEGHSDLVYSISFNPEGQILASGDGKGIIKLWRLDGTLLQTWNAHSGWVTGLSFSPDGQMIASASDDDTIKLWRTNGIRAKTILGKSKGISSVSFSPDGKFLASSGVDGTVKLWRSSDGMLIKNLPGHSKLVRSLSFSANGQMIASASSDKTVRIWNRNGTLLQILPQHSAQITSVSFNPDGKTLASASADGTIQLWQVNGSLLQTFQAHSQEIHSISFSPDGKTLASASEDNTIKLWKFNIDLLQTLASHQGSVYGVSFSPNRQLIASASWDNTVKLWSRNGQLLKTFKVNSGNLYDVKFSPDSQTIAVAGEDKNIKLLRRDGSLLQTLKGHDEVVNRVSFSPNGQMIASASDDTTIKLWRSNGTLIRTLKAHTAPVNTVSFSPNGQIIASGSSDHKIKLWRLDGSLMQTLERHTGDIRGVSFSPNGKIIASASDDKTIKLWRVDGKLLKNIEVRSGAVYSVSFSPDGKLIASANGDYTVKLWNLDGTLLQTLPAHRNGGFEVSFSPDGQTIASASWDNTVILWNWQVLRELDLTRLLMEGCDWLHDYLQTKPKSDAEHHLCD